MFRHLSSLYSLFELLFVEKTSSVSLGIFCFNDTVIWIWVFFIVKLIYLLDLATTIITLILLYFALIFWVERTLRFYERSLLTFVHSHTFVSYITTDREIISTHDVHYRGIASSVVIFHDWSTEYIITWRCPLISKQSSLRNKTLVWHWHFLCLFSLQFPL